jgi:ketosteroid isomerase-like protein
VPSECDDVLATNAAFYAAFESGTPAGMAELWEQGPAASVTHPGWPTLHGWPSVRESWVSIFGHDQLQFIVAEQQVIVRGEIAWVSCTENLLGPDGPLGTVAALNLFAKQPDGTWLIVAHHGSPVAAHT